MSEQDDSVQVNCAEVKYVRVNCAEVKGIGVETRELPQQPLGQGCCAVVASQQTLGQGCCVPWASYG